MRERYRLLQIGFRERKCPIAARYPDWLSKWREEKGPHCLITKNATRHAFGSEDSERVRGCNFSRAMSVSGSDRSLNLRTLEEAVLGFIRRQEGSFEDLIHSAHFLQRSRRAPYNAYCEAFAEPKSWREIPAIPLSAFRYASIRSFPASETICSFRTSGTTGEGYGEHHFRTLELYPAPPRSAVGSASGPRRNNIFCLMPSPIEFPHSSLSCMAGWLALSQRFFRGDWNRLSKSLSRQTNGAVIFGTSLAFLDFFEWLGSREILLPPKSLAVETGGYKGTTRSLAKAERYTLFQIHLGLGEEEIYNEYGMTELSSQFYSRGIGNPHFAGPWVRALVVDPES